MHVCVVNCKSAYSRKGPVAYSRNYISLLYYILKAVKYFQQFVKSAVFLMNLIVRRNCRNPNTWN